MAKESIPLTPNVTCNSKRNSCGGKTLVHYRRASIGSCHDFCKHGKKHESEEKARHPFLKPCDEPNLLESLNLPQRKKGPVTKSKSFPNSVIKLQVSKDSPNGNNSRMHQLLSKKEKATAVAKLNSKHSPNSTSHSHDTIKLQVPTGSSESKTSRKHETLSKEKKISMANLRSSPTSKSRFFDAPNLIQQDGSSASDKVRVSSSKAKEKSFSKWKVEKHLSASVPPESLNSRRNSGIGDMKMGKMTATSKESLKKALASPSASLSPRALLTRATSLTATKNGNLKVLPPQKNQNKVKMAETQQPCDEHDERCNDTLQEKTLYVTKMETENIMLNSDKNENCAAELSPPVASSPNYTSFVIAPPLSSRGGRDHDQPKYAVTEAENGCDSEYDEAVDMEEAEVLEEENRGRPKEAGNMVISNDKDSQPLKLSFGRGKVIDIQSEVNNGPKRLKLRRVRVLGDNQIVKSDQRTFRRRKADGDTNDNKPTGGEKVILRHQDVQGKKDEEGLFNNVIEETASKLVEIRKSKVKALVGAFETIISLQDTNTVT
ncbi:hypothetical protein PTKIN_Ptkin08bG0063900 [Pterospermum kingtungense]